MPPERATLVISSAAQASLEYIGATADVGFSGVPCDPLFESAWDTCTFGVTCRFVKMKVNRFYAEKPVRSRPKVNYKD